MRPWTYKSAGLGLLGLLLVILGVSLYSSAPILFEHLLRKELPLTPSSKAYDVWKDTGVLPPMYLKIYFFNWTNPEELRSPGSKPNLVQVGPYTFREVKQKVNVTFHPKNHTVSYFQRRLWFFDQEKSNGSLTDNVTQLNVVAISAVHKTRFWLSSLQKTLSFMLSSSKLYTVKTVDELLFTGHDDALIRIGRMAAMGEDVPPFDRFGWFYMRNGSTSFDGHFNMDTGEKNIEEFGVLRNWNYKDTTKYYKSPCNVIEGSAGEFWPPHQQKSQISLFSADLCRPLTYSYAETTSRLGVPGYRYVLAEETLGNDTRRRYPHDQAKYFEPTTTTVDFFDADHSAEVTEPAEEEDPDVVNVGNCYCNGKCTPVGLMNITACRYGAPAFVSLPHFHRADPRLRENLVGMRPNDDHDFHITLEPTTGVPLEVSANLQVNILLQPSKTVTLFKDIPTIYFPVFWFSMSVQPTEQLAAKLKQVLSFTYVFRLIGGILAIIGLLIVSAVGLLYLLNQQRASPVTRGKSKSGTSKATSGGKTELIYMDKSGGNDDPHVKSDRKLYPSTIECFNADPQKPSGRE